MKRKANVRVLKFASISNEPNSNNWVVFSEDSKFNKKISQF